MLEKYECCLKIIVVSGMTHFMQEKVDLIQEIDSFVFDIRNLKVKLSAKVDAFNTQQISNDMCKDEKTLDHIFIDVVIIAKSTYGDVNKNTIH